MLKRIQMVLLACAIMLSLALGCNSSDNPVSSGDDQVENTENADDASSTDNAGDNEDSDDTSEDDSGNDEDTGDDSEDDGAGNSEDSEGADEDDTDSGSDGSDDTSEGEDDGSIGDNQDDNISDWDLSETVLITLNGNSISSSSGRATVDGSTVTIGYTGTYAVSGTLSDGQIIVDAGDQDEVELVFDGIDISCSESAPVYIKHADKAIIVLEDYTENHVSDAAVYSTLETDVDEPAAAIFSMSDLTIKGSGSLRVVGNYNDGIASKDELVIKNGEINVQSIDDGIRGKDSLVIEDGTITVEAEGDGLKSDNSDDATRGYISIEAGDITITSGGDAITAVTTVTITGGDIDITTGGGSTGWFDETTSVKGIKGLADIIIDGGTITIESADDAIHSNDTLTINRGTIDITSGDDGIHADSSIEINGGDIDISKSYEGIESASITINDGDIHIVSSDDGINLAGGNDGSSMGDRPGRNQFEMAGDYFLYVNGGRIAVDAAGDGIDSNGYIEMTGGDIIINGPTTSANGALDYGGSFNITDGFLVAAGSSGMAQAPSNSSSQYSVLLTLNVSQPAGTLYHVESDDGEEIFSFAPSKQIQSIAFSSPKLVYGATYEVYYGGSSTGTETDGLYLDGTYTPGTMYTSFTVSGIVTNVGSNFDNRDPRR